MAGANASRIGLADAWDYLGRYYFSGRIATFAFRRGSVDFYQLCKVNAILKGIGYSRAIRSETVRGELKCSGKWLAGSLR